MQRIKFMACVAAADGLGALGAGLDAHAIAVSEGDAALGVRAALERGAVAAVGLLGQRGGFLDNPKVRIELPGYRRGAAKLPEFTGQRGRIDEVVTAMNRAAEAAVPEAKALLVSAVKAMSVKEALGIVSGDGTSAADFFVGKTRAPLAIRFLPIVTRATQNLSLAAKVSSVAGKAADFGLVGKDDANIEKYVTGKALDGLYLMIGEEERKIRADPVGTGSAIVRKVFG